MSIFTAHQWCSERTGNRSQAAVDLTEAQAQDRLRSMGQSAAGERKLIAPEQWRERLMLMDEATVGALVVQRPDSGQWDYVVKTVQGWKFYVWEPDLETAWLPDPVEITQVEAAPAPSRTVSPALPGSSRASKPQLIIGYLVDRILHPAGLPPEVTPALLRLQCDPLWQEGCDALKVRSVGFPDPKTFKAFLAKRRAAP